METIDFSQYVLEKKEDIQQIANTIKGYTNSTKEMKVTDIKTDMNTFVSRVFDGKMTGTLVLPEGITTAYCRNQSGLTELILPSTLKTIPDYAFQSLGKIKQINLPEGLTSIGTYAFHNWSSLQSITIPQSVTKMGSNLFVNCGALKTINVPFSSDSDLASKAPWGATNATVNYNFGNNVYEATYSFGHTERGDVTSFPVVKIYGNDIRPVEISSSGTYTEKYTTEILVVDIDGVSRTAQYSLTLETGWSSEYCGAYFKLRELIVSDYRLNPGSLPAVAIGTHDGIYYESDSEGNWSGYLTVEFENNPWTRVS